MPARVDLGPRPYAEALEYQRACVEEVLAARDAGGGGAELGRILTVEHVPPVITVTRRPGAAAHVLADPEHLARVGVTLCETDRGGDVTYHGPGQAVVYPILDLNRFHLRLHEYMRLLEASVIDVLVDFGVHGFTDPGATGVWVTPTAGGPAAKICAMGVRVRRWVSMHGLALNVSTNLDHFGLIVPCGLQRPVTSLAAVLGERCPDLARVHDRLYARLSERLAARLDAGAQA